ncbi:nucleotidyl transferase AbiEii/AbiGii toxin family protein [soil metagenome]
MRELFNLPEFGAHLTFKGGTSLSKAWKLIARFSEDIDIVIGRDSLGFPEDTLSKNRQKKLIKACKTHIHEQLKPALEARFREVLPALMKWSLIPASVEEDSEQQTLLFHYPSVVVGPADYLNPWVKIELGARSDTEPSELPAIQSYLNEALPTALGEGFFNVRTVSARRTFWEKAMLLHEESYRPPEKRRKARMARHYYDLWCLIEKGIAEQATAVGGLFERVAAHREIFFGQNWVDYATLRPGSLHLLPTADQVASRRSDYEAMREHMFFGDVPTFDEILNVVSEFEGHFNQLALSRPRRSDPLEL